MESKLNYAFARMPIKLGMLLSPELLSVLFVLIIQNNAFKNKEDSYEAHYTWISTYANVSVDAVKKAIEKFVKLGIIELEQTPNDDVINVKINHEEIEKYEALSFSDCRSKKLKITIDLGDENEVATDKSTKNEREELLAKIMECQ